MTSRRTFTILLTLIVATSSLGSLFAQPRNPRRRISAPASTRPAPEPENSKAAVPGETPTGSPAQPAKANLPQDFVLSVKEIQAGRTRGVTLTARDDAALVNDESPDIKVEAVTTSELIIESQQLTQDKKRLLLEVRVPEEMFGTTSLRVMRGNEKNPPLQTVSLVDIKVTEFQALPIPRKATPSGIRRVDLMWTVLPDEVVKDNFGTKAAKQYYGIQVVVGNNTGFDLQIVSLGFKTNLKSPQDLDQASKSAHAASAGANSASTAATANSKPAEPRFQIPVVDHRYVRGTIEKEQAFGTRSKALSFITGFGTLSTGFLPFFHALGPRANFSSFTSILNGNFKEGFGLAVPDLTIRQLNRLENQVMHDEMIIPNNTQERTVVFIPKGIVQFSETAVLEGNKKFKPTIEQIMTFLNELTLVGRRIEYVDMEDREVVVVKSDSPKEAGGTNATKPNTTPAPGPISVDSLTPNFGTLSEAKEVTITGSGFTPDTAVTVKFGDRQVPGKAISATQVKATVPPIATAGKIDVEVIAGTRTDTLEKSYEYFDELRIDSFSPASGPIAGGATVKIKGKGFMSGAEVTVDGAKIDNVSVNNDHNEITITVPAHAAGAVTIVVKNPNGKSFSFANAFMYTAPATPATPAPAPSPSPTGSPTP